MKRWKPLETLGIFVGLGLVFVTAFWHTSSLKVSKTNKVPEPGVQSAFQPLAATAMRTIGKTPGDAERRRFANFKLLDESNSGIGYIEACDSLIGLYEIVSDLNVAQTPPTIQENAAIEHRWNRLLAENRETRTMCDEVDLVASSFKGPKEAGERYILSLLFRIKKRFADDYLLSIHGQTDLSHKQFLPQKHRESGFMNWGFAPIPSTTKWKEESVSIAGESYLLLKRGCPQTMNIPYHIKIVFYSTQEDGRNSEWHGKRIDLGWHLWIDD
jgi:hypothetical protein